MSSLVISLVVSRSTCWGHVGGQSGLRALVGTSSLMRFSTRRRISADRSYGVDSVAGWVFEYPIFVALPGYNGQVSPQPMVITTSEALTASMVRILAVRRRPKASAAAA